MAVTRAQWIKMDREATEAFMAVNPPTFDGYYLQELYEWKHTIGTLFTTCHIEEHLQVYLATMKLAEQALTWWIQQRGTSAHASCDGMNMAMRHKYDADALEQEKKKRWISTKLA